MEQTLATISPLAIVGIVLVSIICPFAVVVGIGGGGFFVPIFVIFLAFSTHQATFLSQSLIFGGTIAAFLMNVKNKHPLNPKKPLLDVNLILLMGPTQLIGIQIGAIINKLLPSYVILAILFIVLWISLFELWKKGKTVKNQTQAAAAAAVLSVNLNIVRPSSQESAVYAVASKDEQKQSELSSNNACKSSAKTIACSSPATCIFENVEKVGITSLAETSPAVFLRVNSASNCIQENHIPFPKRKTFPNLSRVKFFPSLHCPPPQSMLRMVTIESGTPSSLSHGDEITENKTPAFGKLPTKFHPELVSSSEVSSASLKSATPPTEEILATYSEEKDSFKLQWFFVFMLWILGLIFSLLRGIKIPSFDLVTPCTLGYWAILVIFCCFLLTLSISAILYISRINARLAQSGSPLQEGDLRFTNKSLALFCVVSGGAGLLAGIVGVGGGMILGPYLIAKDIPAQVVAAVNALLILLSSSSLAILVVVTGEVPWDYALLLGTICMITAFIGKGLIDAWIKRRNATHYLIFLLFGMILLSALMLIGTFVYNFTVGQVNTPGFELLCSG